VTGDIDENNTCACALVLLLLSSTVVHKLFPGLS